MNENFRLLEFKRKKYIEKRKNSQSKSPKKDLSIERNNVAATQRNFLTSLYEVGGTGKRQQ